MPTQPGGCDLRWRRKPQPLWSDAGVVEDDHGAAVLRPARDVVADRDRTFLAVRDGPHPLGGDAVGDEVFTDGGRAAGAKRDVVFACATLVGVALDGEVE